MNRIPLQAQIRSTIKKSATKALRRSGAIPGVVYHKGEDSVAVQFSYKEFQSVLHTEAGRNALIDLKVKNDKGRKQRTVVVKALQEDPVSGNVLHVDFHQISLTEKITVHIPIHEKGESPGVKNEGGVLESPLKELEVECLPTEIPENIEIDISKLDLNDSIHVKDVTLPESIKVLTDPDMVIVQVKPPVVEKAEETTEEVTEPEVIGEKKEEGEAEEADEGAKDQVPKKDKAEKSEKPEKGDSGKK